MKKKILNLLMAIIVVLIGIIGFKSTNVEAAIPPRTIDNNWNFMLDESTGTLTIMLENGLTSGGLASNKKTEADWKKVWQKSDSDTTDIRPLVKHIKFTTNDVGAKFDFNSKTSAYMFYGFTNLEDIDFSGVKQDSKVAETIRFMFGNCSKLKELDLSWMATKDNSLQNMQDLCNGCSSLEKFTLNNSKFITRKSTMAADGKVGNGAAQMGRMFQGCSKLKEVDMSNITLYGRDDNWTQISGDKRPFGSDLKSLETIKMDNIKLPNYKNLDGVFTGLSALTNFSMKSTTPGDIAPNVETMVGMFENSFTSPAGEGEATLDVSGLGKLNNILNMNDFIAGCKGLENLIIDNLDNSNIGPYNNRHSLSDSGMTPAKAREIGASDYGREIFGKNKYNIASNFPNLKVVSAQNANVWMAKNNRGTPGNELWLAASNGDVLYLTDKKMTFKPDGKAEIQIDSKRDYVDLIIDRDGNHNHTLNPTTTTLPDSGTNKNILGGDLNKLGEEDFRPGKLAPGIYTINDDKWDENKIRPTGSYYRVSYIGKVDYTISDTANDEIEIADVDGVHYINTKNKSKADWDNSKDENGNYVLDCSGDKAIKITYKEAGQDIEGRKYDIEITINKITFKDLDKIPTDPHRGAHDSNKYIDKNDGSGGVSDPDGTYYRTILRASKVDGIMFRNYVRVGNPTGYDANSDRENHGEGDYSYRAISGGSGTDIDFTIKFKPAEGNPEQVKDDKTFVFFVDDLDVPASQEWEYPEADDPCHDTLTPDKATYGLDGEAFVLGSGNQPDTITFAEHTGLRLVNGKTVVTTGSDPSTSWSEFSVKADPKGSNYTWTSGIAADSYALKNTIPPHNEIKVIKEWQDRGADKSPRPDDLDFEIKYTKDGVEKTVVVPSTATWNKTDKANEWEMIFYDEANTFQPAGGYKATEVGPDKYDIVKGDNPIPLEYNEDTGYFEVKFVNKEQTKDVTVTKTWVDTDKQKDKRPNKIRLELIDDNNEVVQTYDLPSTESSHTFKAPKYNKDGDEITYTVNEKEIKDGDLKFYEKSISGNNITNTFKVPEDKFNITVKRVWDDENDAHNTRPKKVTIKLFKGDELLDEYELDTETEESHTFTNLKKYDENGNEIDYKIAEVETDTGDLKFYGIDIGKMQDISPTEKYIEVVNKYRPIPAKVTVKYIDKSTGKEIIKTVVINGSVDDKYKTVLKQFANYRFLESTGNTSGTMTEEDITVIYYYEPEDVAVTGINYGIGGFIILIIVSLSSIFFIKKKEFN